MRKPIIIAQFLAIVLMMALLSYPTWAQPFQSAGNTEKPFWQDYLCDTKDIFTAPKSWTTNDWLNALYITGMAGLLYTNDQDIQESFQNHRNQATDNFSKYIEPLGDPLLIIPSLGLFYVYGQYKNDPKAQEAARLSLESVTIAGGLAYGLKFISHRSRPYQSNSTNDWGGASLSYTDSKMSFPSTHSAIAFSVATVFSYVYNERPWVPYLSYSLASLVALSRINENEHWSSDVFCGSVLGYFTAKSILSGHQNEENNGLTISPIVSHNGTGVLLEYRF